MTSTRQEKVADLVQAEIARLLRAEVRDVRLGFVTVTGVKMSSDLRHARVFVSVMAQGEAHEATMAALRSAQGFLRSRLGRTLRLRHTPEIAFSLDSSIEYGARIERLIEETHANAPTDIAAPDGTPDGPADDEEEQEP